MLPHIPDSLPATFGVLLIDAFNTCVLFGINCMMASQYFIRHSDDPLLVRLTVALTALLATLQVAFLCYTTYFSLITRAGIPAPVHLEKPPWNAFVSAGLTAVVALLVQLFFSYRISRLGSIARMCAVISGIIALAVGALGTAYMVLISSTRALRFDQRTEVLLTAYLSGSMTCDVINSATQIWFIQRSKRETRRMTRVFNRLMVMTINQGLLTCILVFMELVFWFALSNTFAWLLLQEVVAQIYLGSLLASLNARETLRNTLQVEAGALSLSDLMFTIPSRQLNSQLGPVSGIIVTTNNSFKAIELGEIRLSAPPSKCDELAEDFVV